jgi:hypothetical protein
LEAPDLSPDGQYLSYYVNTQRLGERSVYRAVSRWPWLKAVAFWGASSWVYGPGSGLFKEDANALWADNGVQADWDHLGVAISPEVPPEWQSFAGRDFHSMQLQRDGWKAITAREKCDPEESAGIASWWSSSDVSRVAYKKSIPDTRWCLQLTNWVGSHRDENRGYAFDTFALISPSGEVQRCEGWVSADYDPVHRRIVWTQDNVLSGAVMDPGGLGKPSMLFDARRLKFHARQAPY